MAQTVTMRPRQQELPRYEPGKRWDEHSADELNFKSFVAGVGQLRTEDLHVYRLRWHREFLDRLMSTANTGRAIEFNDSTMTRRYIAMAKADGRLTAGFRIRTVSNPYTSTVAVWIERRRR